MTASMPEGPAVRVTKMSGAGNDFIVLGPGAAQRLVPDATEWVRRVCRRGLSVGADGVIFVEPLEPDLIQVRFMNPDGSRAFCGNGTRCAARFARLRGFGSDRMTLDTEAGRVAATVSGDRVTLKLPPPRQLEDVEVEVAGEVLRGVWVDAGSPHFVSFVPDVNEAPLERWAPVVRRHARFGGSGVNVNLVERRAESSIALRTWERGVEGETLACGSGAVASGYVAARAARVRRIEVVPRSGIVLTVDLTGDLDRPDSVELSGDARLVFETELHPEATCGF